MGICPIFLMFFDKIFVKLFDTPLYNSSKSMLLYLHNDLS